MSPVVGQTSLSGYPTYAMLPAGCHMATVNGSVSRAELNIGAVSAADPYVQQSPAAVGKALASVRHTHVLIDVHI